MRRSVPLSSLWRQPKQDATASLATRLHVANMESPCFMVRMSVENPKQCWMKRPSSSFNLGEICDCHTQKDSSSSREFFFSFFLFLGLVFLFRPVCFPHNFSPPRGLAGLPACFWLQVTSWRRIPLHPLPQMGADRIVDALTVTNPHGSRGFFLF